MVLHKMIWEWKVPRRSPIQLFVETNLAKHQWLHDRQFIQGHIVLVFWSQNLLCPIISRSVPLQRWGLYEGFCCTWTWTFRYQLLGPYNWYLQGPRDLSKYKSSEWLLDKLATCLSFVLCKRCLKCWDLEPETKKIFGAFIANVVWWNISFGNCFHKHDMYNIIYMIIHVKKTVQS